MNIEEIKSDRLSVDDKFMILFMSDLKSEINDDEIYYVDENHNVFFVYNINTQTLIYSSSFIYLDFYNDIYKKHAENIFKIKINEIYSSN